MTRQNLRDLMRHSAVAAIATLPLLGTGAQAALVTIDFDAIANPNPFGGPFAFPPSVSEDGFTLSPAGGALQVSDSPFEPISGFSEPNYIRPAGSSAASATLGIEEADGSAFLFVGLDGYSSGPVDAVSGEPLVSGNITVRGFARGTLAAEDVFDIASGFSLDSGGGIVLDPATPFTAVNLAGVAIDRLEIVLDSFDSGFTPTPLFFAFADDIDLDTDAALPLPPTILLLLGPLAGIAVLRRGKG